MKKWTFPSHASGFRYVDTFETTEIYKKVSSCGVFINIKTCSLIKSETMNNLNVCFVVGQVGFLINKDFYILVNENPGLLKAICKVLETDYVKYEKI